MCSKDLLNDLMLKITNYSKEKFGEKFINAILYGSYARGDYDEESDVDVMIVVDMPYEELRQYRWELSCFCADLNLEYNVLITSMLQSRQVLEQRKNVLPFYKNVFREGIMYA